MYVKGVEPQRLTQCKSLMVLFENESLQVSRMLSVETLCVGRGETGTVGNRKQKVNNSEGTVSSGTLVISYPLPRSVE